MNVVEKKEAQRQQTAKRVDRNLDLYMYFNELYALEESNPLLVRLNEQKLDFFVDKNAKNYEGIKANLQKINSKYFEADPNDSTKFLFDGNLPKMKEGLDRKDYDKECDDFMQLPITIKF